MEINILDFIVWFIISCIILYVYTRDEDGIGPLVGLIIILIFSFIYIILFAIIDYDMIDIFNYIFTKIKITL